MCRARKVLKKKDSDHFYSGSCQPVVRCAPKQAQKVKTLTQNEKRISYTRTPCENNSQLPVRTHFIPLMPGCERCGLARSQVRKSLSRRKNVSQPGCQGFQTTGCMSRLPEKNSASIQGDSKKIPLDRLPRVSVGGRIATGSENRQPGHINDRDNFQAFKVFGRLDT